MIDIRYHIYSIAAIFLALAVGIVIGTSFARNSPPGTSGIRTIQRYESDMRVLKNEIVQASNDAADKEKFAKDCEDFCRAVMPIVLKGKLVWRNVAIIQTGDNDDLTGSLKKTVQLAGAQVTDVVEINPEFDFQDSARITSVLSKAGVPLLGNGKMAEDKLFGVIAEGIRYGKLTEVLPKLEDAGVATFTGDYYRPNELVVIVGGSSKDNGSADERPIDSQLIAQLEKRGVVVVGCESTNATMSYISAWHKQGIATVDNADSAMGQISMVYALNGENASFGTKNTADRFIPQTLEMK